MKKETGITLIALVITVIILLILAAVAMSAITGNGGLFTQANNASEAYSQESAKEKLELTLLKMQMNKVEDSAYNADDYLTRKLEAEGIIVTGDIVIVGGYNFEIDRNSLKIKESMGKGTLSNEIKITATSVVATDFTKSTITIEIESANNIETIKIAGKDVETIPAKQNDKYTITQETENNGNYSIFVQDENGAYQTSKAEVSGVTEDMVIRNVAELLAFRDKVNAGASFENRTVTVVADLDLSSVCHAGENGEADVNWEPIATETTPFKGSFDGGYHTISNLYYNSDAIANVGFFGVNNGVIENLLLSNSNISNTYLGSKAGYTITGDFVAKNNGTIKKCASLLGNISADGNNIVFRHIGGIVGQNNGTIQECYNASTITGSCGTGDTYGQPYMAGIAGAHWKGLITNCYNIGEIILGNGNIRVGGGITGEVWTATLTNSFNCGNVTTKVGSSAGTTYCAGISGLNGTSGKAMGTITNCSCLSGISYYYYQSGYKNTSAYSKAVADMQNNPTFTQSLGTAFTNDVKYTDPTDNTEKWKYNNGYPILKWQIPELR